MKAEFIEKDIKIFKPKKLNDIENLIEILQEKETSVLVILPDYDKRKCSADDLLDYILSIIYNLSFFDCEVYFTQEERKAIRDELYKNNDDTIKTVKDIERFVSTVAKSDVKKVLKSYTMCSFFLFSAIKIIFFLYFCRAYRI